MRILILLSLLLAFAPAYSFDRSQVDIFIDEVVDRHDLQRSWVENILYSAEKKQSILDAISRPAERTRAWHEYRDLFVTDQRIKAGVKFWQANRETLRQVSDECGVPEAVIVAILGIETQYGRQTGGYRVVDALSTLAFAYPPRSKFFRSELEQFLLLTNEYDIDPLSAVGSYAGAMGAAQFISSSYRRYAIDASGDGQVDLWNDWRDVIGSIANYLHSFGWKPGEPVTSPATLPNKNVDALLADKLELRWTVADLRSHEVEFDHGDLADDAKVMLFELEHDDGARYYAGFNNFYVITRYNHSRMYAMAVVELGNAIAAQVDP